MEFEQDYIMRMIKSIVSFFIKLITGKSDTVYEPVSYTHLTLPTTPYV